MIAATVRPRRAALAQDPLGQSDRLGGLGEIDLGAAAVAPRGATFGPRARARPRGRPRRRRGPPRGRDGSRAFGRLPRATRSPRARSLGLAHRPALVAGGEREAAALVVVLAAAAAHGRGPRSAARSRSARAPRRAGRAGGSGSRSPRGCGRPAGPTSALVIPRSSTSIAQARASSTGLRSSRAMFSARARSSRSQSSVSRTSAGTVSSSGELRPRAGGARRPPARRCRPRSGRTTSGWSTPRGLDRLGQAGRAPRRRSCGAAGARSAGSARAVSRAGPRPSCRCAAGSRPGRGRSRAGWLRRHGRRPPWRA